MELFVKCLFDSAKSKGWQLLAGAVIGGCFAAKAADEAREPSKGPYIIAGAAIGLSAGLFLLWVDAGQRCREARPGAKITLRERLLIGCLVVGLGIGLLSIASACLMGVVNAVKFLNGSSH